MAAERIAVLVVKRWQLGLEVVTFDHGFSLFAKKKKPIA